MSVDSDYLASLCQDFPGLRLGLDAEAVAAALAVARPGWLPAGIGLKAELGKTYVKPKRYVRIVYHVFNEAPAPVHTWFVGHAAHRKVGPSSTSGDEATLEHGWLVVELFTRDPKLPALPYLVDAEWMRRYFEAHRPLFAAGSTGPLDTVSVLPLKYNPGKRAVVHYSLRSEQRTADVFAKHHAGEQGEAAAVIQEHLHRSLAERSTRAAVPAVLHYDPDLRTNFQEDWASEQLKKICPRLDVPALLLRVLEAAHELHETPIPPQVEQRIDPEDLLRTARGDVEDVGRLAPDLEGEARAIYDRACQLLRGTTGLDPSFVHGSFLLSQILVRDTAVAFIDFDSVGIGDPLVDVSELLASGLYEQWRSGADFTSCDIFWGEAANQVASVYGPHVDPSRLTGYAAAFLLGKAHQHLKGIKSQSTGEAASLCRFVHRFATR